VSGDQLSVTERGILACRQAMAEARGTVYVPQPVKRSPCPHCRAQEYAPCTVKGTADRMVGFHPARYVAAGVEQPTTVRPPRDPQPVDEVVDDRQYDQDGYPIPDGPPEDDDSTLREWYP